MTTTNETETEGAAWTREAMASNFMFIYPKDIEIVPGTPGNMEIAHFRYRAQFLWFLARNKAAQAAILANRFHFIKKISKRRWFQFWRTDK